MKVKLKLSLITDLYNLLNALDKVQHLLNLSETSTNYIFIKDCEKSNKMVLSKRFFYIFTFTIMLVSKRANKIGVFDYINLLLL
jgi:hypothetical protein